jgi:hypothetical protein
VAGALALVVHALSKRHLAGVDPIAALVASRRDGAIAFGGTLLPLLFLRGFLFFVAPAGFVAALARMGLERLGTPAGASPHLPSAHDAAKEQRAPAGNAKVGE